MKSEIRDLSLAPSGHRKIEWVRRNMPLLRMLEEEFRRDQPFAGIRVAPVSYTHLDVYKRQVLRKGMTGII